MSLSEMHQRRQFKRVWINRKAAARVSTVELEKGRLKARRHSFTCFCSFRRLYNLTAKACFHMENKLAGIKYSVQTDLFKNPFG